jgi:hypothetical protein
MMMYNNDNNNNNNVFNLPLSPLGEINARLSFPFDFAQHPIRRRTTTMLPRHASVFISSAASTPLVLVNSSAKSTINNVMGNPQSSGS